MDNKNLPAYPVNYAKYYDGGVGNSHEDGLGGLTKLELVSAMCLQGLLSNPDIYSKQMINQRPIPKLAEDAALAAASLLSHLETESK